MRRSPELLASTKAPADPLYEVPVVFVPAAVAETFPVGAVVSVFRLTMVAAPSNTAASALVCSVLTAAAEPAVINERPPTITIAAGCRHAPVATGGLRAVAGRTP